MSSDSVIYSNPGWLLSGSGRMPVSRQQLPVIRGVEFCVAAPAADPCAQIARLVFFVYERAGWLRQANRDRQFSVRAGVIISYFGVRDNLCGTALRGRAYFS